MSTFSHSEDSALFSVAAAVLRLAGERGLTLGTAESCTGGLIAGALTAVPGSSAVFKGGVVSYWEEVKTTVLDVDEQVIATQGVVSSACAEQMACGARKVLGCDIAVSTTGIAGPGGAEPGKPVGTVWFGVSTPAGTASLLKTFSGNRATVREMVVSEALEIFLKALKQLA